MRRALAIGVAVAACAGAAGVSTAGLGEFRLTKLPKPPFRSATADLAPPPGAPRLVLVSSAPNRITDVAPWFRRNELSLREYSVPGRPPGPPLAPPLPRLPETLPPAFRGLPLVQAIHQPDRVFLVYGKDFSRGRYLVAAEPGSGELLYGFDFADWTYAPGVVPGERAFVDQRVVWAAEAGGVLYVAHSHSTYARSSRRLNAYVTAIDVKRRKVQWRSRALVANARTFELVDGILVTGYGFTAEPDALYLLRARDGRVVGHLHLSSAPEYIIRKGGRIYVRTYDRDVVVRLARQG